jgi:hypothetical protein
MNRKFPISKQRIKKEFMDDHIDTISIHKIEEYFRVEVMQLVEITGGYDVYCKSA